jgi:hypothetical protein
MHTKYFTKVYAKTRAPLTQRPFARALLDMEAFLEGVENVLVSDTRVILGLDDNDSRFPPLATKAGEKNRQPGRASTVHKKKDQAKL